MSFGEGELFGRTRVLFRIVSTGTGAISGKGMGYIMGLGEGVVVSVIVRVLGPFVLGPSEFVGLTTSHLFLGLFYRDE